MGPVHALRTSCVSLGNSLRLACPNNFSKILYPRPWRSYNAAILSRMETVGSFDMTELVRRLEKRTTRFFTAFLKVPSLAKEKSSLRTYRTGADCAPCNTL